MGILISLLSIFSVCHFTYVGVVGGLCPLRGYKHAIQHHLGPESYFIQKHIATFIVDIIFSNLEACWFEIHGNFRVVINFYRTIGSNYFHKK